MITESGGVAVTVSEGAETGGGTTRAIGDIIASIIGVTKTVDSASGQTGTGTGAGAPAQYTGGAGRVRVGAGRSWIWGGMILWWFVEIWL